MDSDGADIELLLITFFYTYMRPLVEEGHLYRAVTPLYIAEKGKEKIYFYTEEEFEQWKDKNKNVKYDLMHCKGLGEISPSVLKEICFENQRFKRINISDCRATTELLDILQGPSAQRRKDYIYEHANRLGFEF